MGESGFECRQCESRDTTLISPIFLKITWNKGRTQVCITQATFQPHPPSHDSSSLVCSVLRPSLRLFPLPATLFSIFSAWLTPQLQKNSPLDSSGCVRFFHCILTTPSLPSRLGSQGAGNTYYSSLSPPAPETVCLANIRCSINVK